MVFDNIEATFEFDPCINYLVTPRLSVQDVIRQQYEIVILGPYQHNEIIKPFVSFQLSKFCQRPGYVRHRLSLTSPSCHDTYKI